LEHKMRILIFSITLPESFLILRRNERDIVKNARRLRVNLLMFL
jgi:hypothetical protein